MSYFNFFRAHDQFIPQHFRFRGGGFMMPRGGNVSITENINIQNGPSGFWGFMTGLSQGLFGGGMGYGMGMGGSIFGCQSMPMMGMGMQMPMLGMGSYPMLNGATTSQGTGDQKNPDLDNLNAFFGGKGYVIRQEKDGTYTAAKDGKIVASGKYDDVKAKLSELADGTTADEAKDTPEAKAKVHVPKLEKDENGKWKDANGNEYTWDSDNKCFHKVQASGTEGGGKTEAQLQQEAAAAHDPKLELKNGKWVDSSGKEYEWKDGKFEPKTSTDTDEVDTSHQGGRTRRTDRSGGGSRTRGTESPERIDDGKKVSDKENKSAAYTASVKWTTVPIMNSFHIIKGYQCTAIVSFTDKNGDSHVYKHTDKFESYTETGREAKCKAQVIGHIQNSIKKEGWTNVTIK